MAKQPACFRWLLSPLVLGRPGIRGPYLGNTEACTVGRSALSRPGRRGAVSSQPPPGTLLHVATVVLKFPGCQFLFWLVVLPGCWLMSLLREKVFLEEEGESDGAPKTLLLLTLRTGGFASPECLEYVCHCHIY